MSKEKKEQMPAGEGTPAGINDGKKKKRKKYLFLFIPLGLVFLAVCYAFFVFFFIKPEFTVSGSENTVSEVLENYGDEGVKASILGIDISDLVETENNVDPLRLGTYEVKYSLHFHAHDYTLVRNVEVKDTLPPEITLMHFEKGDIVSSADKYEEAGYIASDAFEGDLTDRVEITKEEKEDLLTLTYRVSDSSGNEAYAVREVEIKDIVPPEIKLKGETEMTVSDGVFDDPGAEAKDDTDGDITDKITIESDYKEKTEGEFTFVYKVSDSSGNEAKAKRKVTVKDTEGPVITLAGAEVVYLASGSAYYEAGAAATDAFDGECEVTVSSPSIGGAGEYEAVYTSSDSRGNTSSRTRKIIVMSSTAGSVGGGGVVSNSTIYLTFDDGPSYLTPEVLDILKANNVKATFFIVGYSASGADIIRRAINEGHTIGLHGMSHDYGYIYSSVDNFVNNISSLKDAVQADFGYTTNIFRFPGGSSNTVSANYCSGIMSTLAPLMESLGYTYFDWNISSGDASGAYASPTDIYYNVVNALGYGRNNVVLMHDAAAKRTTVDALQSIISYGLNNGFTFAALSSSTPPVHHNIFN